MVLGIDAGVVLGLAGKAVQVFAEPGTFLSFPLAPLGFQGERLAALVADPFGPKGSGALAEFSQLVNEIPEGALWQPDGDHLWTVYGDVLGAELAGASLTPGQREAYTRAYTTLYTEQGDGTAVPSPPAAAYERFRDAYIAVVQEYNNRKGQAALSAEQAVAEAWAADEPRLAQAVREAMAAWRAEGHREEVEAARAVLRELGAHTAGPAWEGYRRLFDPGLPEIYFRTGPDGTSYLPTGYLPGDVIGTEWPMITVAGTELGALAAAAPAELRDRLGSCEATAILSVSFDYTTVTVTRPWFAPEVFASRAWRFRDGTRVLSDGGAPPSGECPAYVAGVVLVRGITVRRKTGDAGTLRPMGFLPSTLSAVLAEPPATAATVLTATPVLAAISGLTLTEAAAPVVRDHRRAAAAASAAIVRDHRGDPGPVVRDHRDPAPVVRDHRIPVLPTAPPPRPEEPAVTTVTSDPGEVYVLAFLCRYLPKSPNPDPALSWPSA